MTQSSNKPIRVLQLVGSMNRAGLETWLMHILRNVDRRKLQIDIATMSGKPGDYDEEILSLGSKIYRIGGHRNLFSTNHRFQKILQENGPFDVVHSHLYWYSGFMLRAAAKSGVVNRIAHFHPTEDHKQGRLFRNSYVQIAAGLIRRYATQIVACSQSSLKASVNILGNPPIPTAIIPNVVDIKKFNLPVDRDEVRTRYGLPLNKTIILYVARFSPHKNHAQAIRIADQLHKEGLHHLHFVFVGSCGELKEHVTNLVKGKPNITCLTDVAEVVELHKASDLFFFPSTNEGFGVVAIEAQAAGLPVVATNLPTIQEACCPAVHPYMFPPNDDKKATRNIQKILKEYGAWNELCEQGIAHACKFSIDNSLKTLHAQYSNSALYSRHLP